MMCNQDFYFDIWSQSRAIEKITAMTEQENNTARSAFNYAWAVQNNKLMFPIHSMDRLRYKSKNSNLVVCVLGDVESSSIHTDDNVIIYYYLNETKPYAMDKDIFHNQFEVIEERIVCTACGHYLSGCYCSQDGDNTEDY